MKLFIDGDINRYYVQTLCMIFFPGAKFPENEDEAESTHILNLKLVCTPEKAIATAKLWVEGKESEAQREYLFTDAISNERTRKLAVGAAVLSAAEGIVKHKPAWGMLIGVRPSKVAMEMLNSGLSKTRTKKILTSDFLVTPKKAGLAIDVAKKEQKIIGNHSTKDCSVYISIPFCPTRCSYCSFVSYTSDRLLSMIPDYVVRLCKDVRQIFATIDRLGLNLKTIYVGGGTPTILTVPQIEALLGTINECTDVSRLEEFTFEAGRPDTITAEKLAAVKKFGVTRISVNTQSLAEEVLCKIGRMHSREDFVRAFNIARESGIKCINTDIIAGLPGDKFRTFSASIDEVLVLRPENITVHTFCVKKSADILQQNKNIYSVNGGDVGKCVDYSQLRAGQEGYSPYYMYRQKNTVGNLENVGFALEGYEGLYNIYMMEEVHSIFAAGAGAVTKLVDYRSENNGKIDIDRIFNPKYPYEYLREENCEKFSSDMENIVKYYYEHELI